MRKGLNKFIRGASAIIVIKIVFVGGAFLIHSCQTDNLEHEILDDAKSDLIQEVNFKTSELNNV